MRDRKPKIKRLMRKLPASWWTWCLIVNSGEVISFGPGGFRAAVRALYQLESVDFDTESASNFEVRK